VKQHQQQHRASVTSVGWRSSSATLNAIIINILETYLPAPPSSPLHLQPRLPPSSPSPPPSPAPPPRCPPSLPHLQVDELPDHCCLVHLVTNQRQQVLISDALLLVSKGLGGVGWGGGRKYCECWGELRPERTQGARPACIRSMLFAVYIRYLVHAVCARVCSCGSVCPPPPHKHPPPTLNRLKTSSTSCGARSKPSCCRRVLSALRPLCLPITIPEQQQRGHGGGAGVNVKRVKHCLWFGGAGVVEGASASLSLHPPTRNDCSNRQPILHSEAAWTCAYQEPLAPHFPTYLLCICSHPL